MYGMTAIDYIKELHQSLYMLQQRLDSLARENDKLRKEIGGLKRLRDTEQKSGK